MELDKLNSNIVPINILRENNYNKKTINKNSKYISASSIREHLLCNKQEQVKEFLPDDVYNLLIKKDINNNNELFNIIKYKIITKTVDSLKDINEVTEGLENKIKKCILTSNSYDEFIKNIKSKRYNMSKIKRMVLNILLDIKKDDFNNIYENQILYSHILAMSNDGKKLLGDISRNSSIPIITSISDKKIKSYDKDMQYLINKDILSTNVHSIINNSKLNMDYLNKL